MQPIKELIRDKSPFFFRALKQVNSFRLSILENCDKKRITKRNERVAKISRSLFEQVGQEVQRGPFKGMLLPPLEDGYWHPSKLCGTYEEELYPILTSLSSRAYQRVINVGCGDGYFVVGLARNCPESQVYGYDVNENSKQVAKSVAAVNMVSNVQFEALCSHESLSESSGLRTLVFCDCEGCEDQLLNPEPCPSLKEFDILVETHDHIVERITETLISRFKETHEIEALVSKPRTPEAIKELSTLPKVDRSLALDELRHKAGGTWLWMKAR